MDILNGYDASIAHADPARDADFEKETARFERKARRFARKAAGLLALSKTDRAKGRDADWYRAEYGKLMARQRKARERFEASQVRKVRVATVAKPPVGVPVLTPEAQRYAAEA